MAMFAYTGVDSNGKSVRGTVDADSIKSVRAALKKKGISLDDARQLADGDSPRARSGAGAPVPSGSSSERNRATTRQAAAAEAESSTPSLDRLFAVFKKFGSKSNQAVAMATRQLGTLIKAGIPLPEALTAILGQMEDEELRKAFSQVSDQVRQGIPFAKALEEHPNFFGNLYVNMCAAGEATGNLDAVLARLAEYMESQVKLRGKVTSALAYPIFMALFGMAIVGLMMVVVVPKVSEIFEDFKQSLPWYTSALIKTSNFLANWWWLVLGLGVGGFVMFRRWKNTPEGRYSWDSFSLRMPIFGELFRLVAVARFARTLATLLASGVPLLKALDIVKNVMENKVLEAVVVDAATSVREGESLADPLRRSGRFPPLVTHMIAIGEKAGELEGMLNAVANSYDTTIETRVATITSLLEPIMIVVMGGAQGGITFAIMMPLLKLRDMTQQQ